MKKNKNKIKKIVSLKELLPRMPISTRAGHPITPKKEKHLETIRKKELKDYDKED